MYPNDSKNIKDKPIEPEVNDFKVGNPWDTFAERGKKWSQNKERSNWTHESVSKIDHIYE